MQRVAAIVCIFLLAAALNAPGANTLRVEGTTAVSGATGVDVRILADCDQEVVALSFASAFPAELSNVSVSLGSDTAGAGKTYLSVEEAGGYFSAGIIIEWRETSGGSSWGALPAETGLHVLTLTCDVASGLAVGTNLTIDLRDDLGSPPIRPVFTDQNANSIIPALQDGAITIVEGPSITNVTPQWGPVNQTTSVTIMGSNFKAGATVTFGTQAALNVVVQDSGTITCDAPAVATAAVVDVTVDNGPQYGFTTKQNAFEYVNLPEVTSVTPSAGSTSGGTHVVISGNYFKSDSTVEFDGIPLSNITYVDANTLEGDTPAHAAGFVNVTVINTYYGDQVSDTLINGFEYVEPPTITSITPDAGHGDETATITGTNFRQGETSVYFGGTACTNVNVVSTTELTCLLPPCPGDGPVDISVETPGGTATLTGGYECTNTYRRGDANCDSTIDIADPITILSYLFQGGTVACLAACDVNNDDSVDISDPVYDLMYLFRQGFPPPDPPFPDLGVDPDTTLPCAQQCGS